MRDTALPYARINTKYSYSSSPVLMDSSIHLDQHQTWISN